MSLVQPTDRFVHPSSIRRLRRGDAGLLREHLIRLDAQSRHSRFGAGVNDAFLRRYAEQALEGDVIAKGLFVGLQLRGIAELRGLCDEWPEAAFCLEPGWQGHGYGALLFASLLDAARNSGVCRFELRCLRSNTAMQRIARRHAAELRIEDGEIVGNIRHPGSDEASRSREAAEEQRARVLLASRRGLYRLASEAGVDLRLNAA